MEPASGNREPLLQDHPETQPVTLELPDEEDGKTPPCDRNGGEHNLGPQPGSTPLGNPRDSNTAAKTSCSIGSDGELMIDGVHLI